MPKLEMDVLDCPLVIDNLLSARSECGDETGEENGEGHVEPDS